MNVDYDIHGQLVLRLVDPPENVARFVAREFHPIVAGASSAGPDVSLAALAAGLPEEASYRLGNAGDYQQCAFGDSDFCLLVGGRALCVPFESIGASCQVRYSPGLSPRVLFSYVRPLLHLSLLPKGALAVHSAAMMHEGKGILFAGWAESGKTEAMLGFLRDGASFVSDKWTIIREDGSAIFNFPTTITVRQWALAYLPELAKNLTPLQRWRLRLGPAATALAEKAEGSNLEPVSGAARVVRPALELGGRVSATPSQLFRAWERAGGSRPLTSEAPLDKLFFLMTTTSGDVSVRPASQDEVVGRLVDCGQYERRGLLGLYTKFKYAFPERRSAIVEESREREVSMLSRALESKELFMVEVPFPFDPLAVREALDPFC